MSKKYDYAPDPNSERKMQVIDALIRVQADFTRVGHRYFDARIAVESFLMSEFDLTDTESGQYIVRLEEEGILPTAELYDHNNDAALRMHRLAMFTQWMPLYRALHDDADAFKMWVPHMLEVAVPRDDVHTAACRDDRMLNALSTASTVPCWMANECPVNTIATHVLMQTPFLPVYLEEYDVFDAGRAQQDALSLLQAVSSRGFINQHETRGAVQDVHQTYHYLLA